MSLLHYSAYIIKLHQAYLTLFKFVGVSCSGTPQVQTGHSAALPFTLAFSQASRRLRAQIAKV